MERFPFGERNGSDFVCVLCVSAPLRSKHRIPMPPKLRLDQLLVARGLFESREKAQRAIMAGEVSVAEKIVDKAGTRVAEDATIAVKSAERYVGRGGYKLEAALAHFEIKAEG